jgi:hypothetical protein
MAKVLTPRGVEGVERALERRRGRGTRGVPNRPSWGLVANLLATLREREEEAAALRAEVDRLLRPIPFVPRTSDGIPLLGGDDMDLSDPEFLARAFGGGDR